MIAYRPHPLLRNGHLQTIMGSMTYGVSPPYQAIGWRVPLPDGESLVVHEERNSTLTDDCPIAILVHGLGGCHQSPYLQRVAHRLGQTRLRCWRVDLRGSGEGLKFAYRPAHAGSSEDLAAVVAHAQSRFPQASVMIVGFSLGGGILLKMLGEAAAGILTTSIDLARVRQALAIAPPIDLETCSANIERMSRRIYAHYYLTMLSKQVALRANQWPQWRAISPHPPVRTIRQFDDRYTVPLGGFDSTDHYYAVSSSQQWLDKITTPTKLLVDQHDPIVPVATFMSTSRSPEVEIEFTRFGGHLGYIGRDEAGKIMRWMEYWVVEHLLSSAQDCSALDSRAMESSSASSESRDNCAP